MSLVGQLLPVTELTAGQRRRMYELMDRHYANVRPDAFEADLAEKRWVILLLDPLTREVCGFSTQRLLTAEVRRNACDGGSFQERYDHRAGTVGGSRVAARLGPAGVVRDR